MYQIRHTYKLTLAYDGTHYCGWLVQPNAISIQSLLNKAIKTLVHFTVPLTASGRTDAGVHAKGQVIHFPLPDPVDPSRFIRSLNALLPDAIVVLDCEEVPLDFHARYSAKKKHYRYSICPHLVQTPFRKRYCLHHKQPLDKPLLQRAMRAYLGTHDFTSFANKGGSSKEMVKTIFRSELIEEEEEWHLDIEGDGFLYRMVRNMVGLALEVATNKRALDEIPLILKGRDRRLAGKAAPAHGLCLMKVSY